jgi:hypothetical protein
LLADPSFIVVVHDLFRQTRNDPPDGALMYSHRLGDFGDGRSPRAMANWLGV